MDAAAATLGESGVRYPPAPEGCTFYVIGDIHGRLDLLLEVQRRIDDDKASFPAAHVTEIYLGDYIDRGPESAGVVTRLIGRAQETHARFLRGNHEQMLLDFLAGDDACLDLWRTVGGMATLHSYGVKAGLATRWAPASAMRRILNERLPPEHRSFFEQTGSYIRMGAYLAVHAGIRPGVRLEDQHTADLLSIRGLPAARWRLRLHRRARAHAGAGARPAQ